MSVSLHQLAALVAVVDEGSFTDAAIALGVSQASVSRSVAGLEAAVGARVLVRTTRSSTLTAVGTRVLGHARRALGEAAAVEHAATGTVGELRVGFSWAALGTHTTAVQQRWGTDHPGSPLVFVQSGTRTAGLQEGAVEVAVLRRPLTGRRFATAMVGVEQRVAALPDTDPLRRRRTLTLADVAGRTIAVDRRTGTTTLDLWPRSAAPTAERGVDGVDEWLTVIAAGQAVGVTAEATAHQYPRPGIVYRRVRDAPPVPVWLAWWRDDPSAHAEALLRLVCEVYAGGDRT
ncbi:MAG: LysR family transcriptional regulator [Nocardioidaceae bacterium]